jgi:hypothetical protein
MVSVDIGWLMYISTCQSPLAPREAVDIIRYWVVQLFHDANTTSGIPLSLESGKGDSNRLSMTPRAMPFMTGN